MPLLINLPFAGFYETKWSGELDSIEEREAEYFETERQQEDGVPKDLRLSAAEYGELRFKHTDYGVAHAHIAREYVEYFDSRMSELFGFKLRLKFESMSSPRYYNFETDRLFAYISKATAKRLFKLSKEDKHEKLSATIKERFTSYDGFRSHYSNDLAEWLEKPLDAWDHNELGTLLIACMALWSNKADDSDEWEWELYYSMCESNVFDTALDNAVNWSKLEEEIGELRREKLEELRADNPDYEIPYRCPETLDLFKHYKPGSLPA